MKRLNKLLILGSLLLLLFFTSCVPTRELKIENSTVPESFLGSSDSTNAATIDWQQFFNDPYLSALIDTALNNNQELNILLQEIEISSNEVLARKGEYQPTVGVIAGAGVEKPGRYTPQGAMEATTEIEPGVEMPDPVPNYMLGAVATWEIDIWKKLRNAKKSAMLRYLASVEGKNFMVTHLIAEIANSYYELLALDNQLDILQKNIAIQANALEIVKLQKESARVTELAVRRFEAQVLNTKSMQFLVQQQIVEAENRINFLLGRFPQHVDRDFTVFQNLETANIDAGLPAQLLANRPDIKQAELALAASKLDIKVARAKFYPSLSIAAGIGLEAFNPAYIIQTPQSMLYNLIGELAAPLINRKGLKAQYFTASAKQIQAVYDYERTILGAYIEVYNQVSKIDNLGKSYALKEAQVEALTESIDISNGLFRSARADYMEVLLTQRDALESKFELIETKKQQLNAMVNIYQALGGGWK